MYVYAIVKKQDRIFSFLLKDGKAVEIHCDEAKAESLLGNIYIGKIKNIAKNIGAAFVEIAPGVTCYLALDDIKNPIYTRKGKSDLPQAGDELLVEVSREGIKSKFPAVTTNITLYGKYALLTTGNCQIAASAKLPQEKRKQLIHFAASAEGQTSDDSARSYGWLLRTNAGTASGELLRKDMLRLKKQYEYLAQQAHHRTCFSCLMKRPQTCFSRLSDLYDTADARIVTDDASLYEELKEYLTNYQPEDLHRLTFYQDELLPMSKLYSLEHQLREALNERVWLKSGGYLVIQPTEALTVIDVNSGKYEGGKKKEATFLKVNLEAAAEIARQIRLRNISGIIIVDFINMETKEARKQLMEALETSLKEDPVKTALVDMTKLFLVEITRMKKERPLSEQCAGSDLNCPRSTLL